VTTIEPVDSAKAAGVPYVSDDRSGIRRVKRRGGFTYVGVDGADESRVLAFIEKLGARDGKQAPRRAARSLVQSVRNAKHKRPA